jgi:hypothetical protein
MTAGGSMQHARDMKRQARHPGREAKGRTRTSPNFALLPVDLRTRRGLVILGHVLSNFGSNCCSGSWHCSSGRSHSTTRERTERGLVAYP